MITPGLNPWGGHLSSSSLPPPRKPRARISWEDGDRGRARGPWPRTLHCARPKPPKTRFATPGSSPPAFPLPSPAQGPSSPPALQRHRRWTPTPASLEHTPHTKALRPPPSRPHSPTEQSMRWPAPAFPPCTPQCGARPAGAAVRLTIAALDLHVNPDLDLAEVGRCHHLIWSSGGGPREGDGRAEKAGRGRGRCGRRSGCPRPRRPGRQREREPGLREAEVGRRAEAPGLQAGGRTRTPGRRGEARAGAVRRRGGEWEDPRRPPGADAGEAGRRAPAQSAPPASLPLRSAFPGCLEAAPPSSAAGGRRPRLGPLRERSARPGPQPAGVEFDFSARPGRGGNPRSDAFLFLRLP